MVFYQVFWLDELVYIVIGDDWRAQVFGVVCFFAISSFYILLDSWYRHPVSHAKLQKKTATFFPSNLPSSLPPGIEPGSRALLDDKLTY